MRCIIWAAVSSPEQAKDDKESIPSQIADAEALINGRGWTLVDTIVVAGHSRSHYVEFSEAVADLEAYARLKQHIQARDFDLLVVRARDRLARLDCLCSQIEQLLRDIGAQVYSMAFPIPIAEDIQQDRSLLISSALERALGQSELVELKRRHRSGMYARIKRGLMASNPPFGYRHVGKDVPPAQVPEELAILRKIYALYMEGMGCPQIAGWLNRQNVLTLRGGRWRDQTIKYILANVFYAGWVSYGNLVEPGQHEPLWTAEEWAALKAERRRRQRTRGKSASVFSGLVRCTICEHNMSVCSVAHSLANREPRRYRYFRCVEGQHRRMEHRGDAHGTQVSVRLIRAAVLEEAERLRDPEEMEARLREKLALAQHEVRLREREELEVALAESAEVVKRLLDAHARWGRLSTEAFDEAMAEAAEHQEKLEAALGGVLADLEEMPDPEVRAGQWRELAYGDLETILDDADVKRANAWLARHVRAIWCSGNRVERVELI